jgi:hypothetical protein
LKPHQRPVFSQTEFGTAFRDVVHLAANATVAGVVERRAGVRCMPINEDLGWGPTSVDRREQARLRRRYLKLALSADVDRALERQPSAPVCVWLRRAARDTLFFWSICSSCRERDRPVFAAVFGGREMASGLLVLPETYLNSRLAPALPLAAPRPVSRPALRAYAALWAAFCDDAPHRFWRLSRRSERARDVSDLHGWYAQHFPRREAGRLRLSRFDELLLCGLSSRWTPTERLFTAGSRESLKDWLALELASMVVDHRLRQWSQHAEGRILERSTKRVGQSELFRESYRWAPGGNAILDGLDDITDAPPMYIGGVKVYDPKEPSVCRMSRDGEVRTIR